MRSKIHAALAAGLVLAGVAAIPTGGGFTSEDARSHLTKAEVVRASEAPAERLSDVPCVDGAAGPFACEGVDLLGFVPEDEMVTADTDVLTGCALDVVLGGDRDALTEDPTCLNKPGLSDVWGWTSEDGGEYVVFGKTNGTAFYRVTDPTAPEYLGEIPNASGQLLWHDIKVFEDNAYIVSESIAHGVKVFDLTRLEDLAESALPYNPLDADSVWFPEDQVFDLSNHNVVIDETSGTLYLVGGNLGIVLSGACSGGLYAFDLNADALNPPFAGCFEAAQNAYVHDAQCGAYVGPDADHRGKEICVTSSEDFVAVVDVTDKANMVELSRTVYPSVTYAHQGWMSEDMRFYYHGDELDEQSSPLLARTRTIVVDMTDLDAIRFAGVHTHENKAIDHNMYTRDGLLFQSNYTSGLRVLDTAPSYDDADPAFLEEVAFFDTFPDDDDDQAPIFAGTWSNYPYFPSGTIAVTGIGEGLFLLRLQDGVSSALLDEVTPVAGESLPTQARGVGLAKGRAGR